MNKNFLTLSQQNPIQYRETVYKSARLDIENLVNRFGLKGKTMLSIASGYGAEEDLFTEMGCRMVCIEPDPVAVAVHVNFKSPDLELHQMDIETFLGNPDKNKNIDAVYVSSDSTWMYSSPLRGIPEFYLRLFHVIKPKLFIAKLYGGKYRTNILKSGAFLDKLKSQVPVSEYWITDNQEDKNAAVLIAFGEKVNDTPLSDSRGSRGINLYDTKSSFIEKVKFIFNVRYWQFKVFVNKCRGFSIKS